MNKALGPGVALEIRRTESLTSLVRRELERMIEVGELKAGDRLNENALALKLGVSRGPVREACRGLEQSGLVQVATLRGLIDEMEAAAERDELNVFYPLNLRFHEAIIRFSDNARLAAFCTSVHRETHLFRRRTLDMPGRMKLSNAEHRRIVDAIAAGNGESAMRELERHVLDSRDLLFGGSGKPAD